MNAQPGPEYLVYYFEVQLFILTLNLIISVSTSIEMNDGSGTAIMATTIRIFRAFFIGYLLLDNQQMGNKKCLFERFKCPINT